MKILWDPIWENRKEWKEIWKEWPWNHRKSSIIFQNFCQNSSGLAIRSTPHNFKFLLLIIFPLSPILNPLNRTLQTNFCIYELEKLVQTSIIIISWYTLNALWFCLLFDRFIPRFKIQDSRFKIQGPRLQDLKTKKRPRRLKITEYCISFVWEENLIRGKNSTSNWQVPAGESEDEWDWRLESECPFGSFRAGIWIPSLS